MVLKYRRCCRQCSTSLQVPGAALTSARISRPVCIPADASRHIETAAQGLAATRTGRFDDDGAWTALMRCPTWRCAQMPVVHRWEDRTQMPEPAIELRLGSDQGSGRSAGLPW